MQSSKVQITFGSETLYLKLTDNPDEFMKAICTAFKIKQFTAKVEMNNLKLIFEFRNPNQIKKEEMLKIIQSGCKCIKIIEIKDQSNQVNKYQFFEAFVNGKDVQCCARVDCQLCSGNGQAKIYESDQPFINEVVKNKLKERLPEISDMQNFLVLPQTSKKRQVKHRFSRRFFEIPFNYQKQSSTVIYDNNTSKGLCSIQLRQKWYEQLTIQDILQDDKYKVKIIEQSNIEGVVGGEAVMQLKYMNDGSLNWPQKVQLVCTEGPFQIRQDIKSAMNQQTISQEIKIHIPDIHPDLYEFTCRFEYQNEQNIKIQFGPVIKLKLMVKEKNRKIIKPQNFDEQNRNLIPELKSQLLSMGYKYETIVQKMNAIFQNSTNRKLTLEGFMNEFFQND